MIRRGPIDLLKVWLDNTPFKSQDSALKKQTLLEILGSVQKLKEDEINNALLADGSGLNDKLAITLSKYIFKGFELIANADAGK